MRLILLFNISAVMLTFALVRADQMAEIRISKPLTRAISGRSPTPTQVFSRATMVDGAQDHPLVSQGPKAEPIDRQPH